MGKVFETLKRRSLVDASPRSRIVPHNPLAVQPPESVPPASTSPVRVLPSLDYLNAENLPFYEVPNELKNAHVPVEQATAAPASQPAPPFTLSIPQTRPRPRSGKCGDAVVVVRQPESQAAQQYRAIRDQVWPLLTASSAQTLLLLPLEQAGRVAVFSANLGAAFAEKTQHPILLIDASQDEQGLAGMLGLTTSPGWEELLAGLPLAQVVQQSGHAWLDVITAGRRLARSTPAVWARRAGKHLRSLQRHYRLLLVTSPPWPHSPMAPLLAQATDAACLVLEPPQVGHALASACVDVLQDLGKCVVGSVVMTKD